VNLLVEVQFDIAKHFSHFLGLRFVTARHVDGDGDATQRGDKIEASDGCGRGVRLTDKYMYM